MTASPNLREVFRQEAQDLLEQLEQALLDLEADPAHGELIDTAFRALHTIKGSGAMCGYEAVAGFAHHVENAFDRVRQGKLAPGRELVALALAAQDHIRRLIEAPDTAGPGEAARILGGLSALVGASETAAPPAAPAVAAPTGPAAWRIRMRLPRDAMAMGTNPLLLLDELRALGEARVTADASALPPLAELAPAECYLGWTVMLTTAQPPSAIEDVFLFVRDGMELQIEPVSQLPAAPPAPVPPAVAAPPLPAPPTPVVQDNAPPPPRAEPAAKPRASDSVRVPAERLDDLMDRVGELVIAQSRLTQVAMGSQDPQVKSIAEEIERLTLELRDSTMGVRTVPIGSLFGRFRRLVHDLSSELGKEIVLSTSGEDTELDKTVVERLNDPLIHLLRNAIDHGLEPPDGRAAAGKPAQGRLTLAARHAGAEVLIRIADDGRGLDRARIRARAEERGLLAPGQAVGDAELFAVIFSPGFSTAAQVTNLSGRGVGMDVVKRAIDALRGKVEIASIAGQGTDLTLRLPLTLAIIDGLLVRVGAARYVLPLSAVEECVALSSEQDARSRGRNFLNIRGELVPFLRLRELFAAASPPDPFQKVVVVSAGAQRVGLVVDQVIGNHQTVIKSLSRLHAGVRMFSGATILGDGAVALILDVTQLVEFGQIADERLRAAG